MPRRHWYHQTNIVLDNQDWVTPQRVSNITSGPLPFPTVTNSTIWISHTNSYTDTAGATPANVGDSVWTIKLPTGGWGSALGDGLVRQNTSGKRPTLRADGFQGDGSTTTMDLPVALALAGDCTLYWVATRGGAGRFCCPLGVVDITNNHFDAMGFDSTDNNCYGITYPTAVAGFTADNSFCIRRMRRSSGTLYYKQPSVSETSAALAGTFNVSSFMARVNNPVYSTDTNARIYQVVVVNANIVPGSADDLAIIAKLQELCPGVSGP